MRLRADLATARGETAGVEDASKGAIGLFREIEYRIWVAVTLCEQARWLIDRQRAADARPLIVEARSIFESLGAEPWLTKADGLASETAAAVSVADR